MCMFKNKELKKEVVWLRGHIRGRDKELMNCGVIANKAKEENCILRSQVEAYKEENTDLKETGLNFQQELADLQNKYEKLLKEHKDFLKDGTTKATKKATKTRTKKIKKGE